MENPNTDRASSLPDATRLAIERTQLAADRTILAWVRTATSLISFGFTIFKFFDGKEGQGVHWLGYRGFSLLMICIGLFCLVVAVLQHRRERQSWTAQYGVSSSGLSQVLAMMIAVLGIFGLAAVLIRG